MTTKEILEGAAELVKKGWTQGAYGRDANGSPDACQADRVCWCALGAITQVASKDGFGNWDARVALANKIRGQVVSFASLPSYANVIADWNDAEGRTQEEVVDLLLSCAKDCK